VCDHIERVAYGPAQTASESSTVTASGDYTVTVEHDRDWTWLFFDAKPSVEVRDRLKGMGARWGRKKQGWYFQRDVPDEELTWLTGDAGEAKVEAEAGDMPDTPLELARRLWSEHRPEKQGDAQQMVYDYVPEWLAQRMPKLYSQDKEGHDPVVWLKLFLPEGRWTFYVTEYSEVAPDETPNLFFGYLASPLGPDCDELCYMTLEQIQELRGARLRSRVERDLWWKPKLLSEVKSDVTCQDDRQDALTETVQTVTELHEPSDLAARVEEIKAREGQPCTVVVTEGEIVNVITPAWLYERWIWYALEEKPSITGGFDASARQEFANGDFTDSDFCRFCRCTVQGALAGQDRETWEKSYRSGADFDLSAAWPNWVEYIGTPEEDTPEPKFEVGDRVARLWGDEPEDVRPIQRREYDEFAGKWKYRVNGQFTSEEDLVLFSDLEEKSDDEPDTDEAEPSLPTGWTEDDIAFLLEKLQGGPILVADVNLGIPTIHDFGDARHMGFGMFEVKAPEYTLQYDAGAGMKHTPSSRGSWTRLCVIKGEYSYPFDDVRARLEAILADANETVSSDEVRVRAKLNQRLDDRYALWIGETWEDAIRQSFTTPDAGIEETESGYRLFGWGNGYEHKYTRPIPSVLNLYVEQAIQDQKESVSEQANPWDGKEAWEMTRELFRQRKAAQLEAAGHINAQPYEAARLVRRSEDGVEQIGEHQLFVEQALPDGQPVPAEVLDDYPDLVVDLSLQAGETVWWEKDGNVLTGVVTHVYKGEVTVKCDDHLTVAGGVPIERLERFPLSDLNAGPVPEEHLQQVVEQEVDTPARALAPGDVFTALFQEVQLPDPVIDLDAGMMMEQLMEAATKHSYVHSDETMGRGANHGKLYVHFFIDAASAGSAVKFKGQLYGVAETGPIHYDPANNGDVAVTGWKPRKKLSVQEVRNLLNEAASVREEYPNEAAKANRLYRKVLAAYNLDASYGQSGLLKFWLSLWSLVASRELGEKFEARLIGRSVNEALQVAFGVQRWQDIILDETELDKTSAKPAKSTAPVAKADADDGPEYIEVDLGRTHGWALAEVKRERGKWLYYRLTQDKTDKRGGRVQVIGRDILWRPASPASREGVQ